VDKTIIEDDRSGWVVVNMQPGNPAALHDPEHARTPSPKTFFSRGKFPDAGVYQKIYSALRSGQNPWAKKRVIAPVDSPPATGSQPSNDSLGETDITMQHSPPQDFSILDSPVPRDQQPGRPSDEQVVVTILDSPEHQNPFETPPRKPKLGMSSPNVPDDSGLSSGGKSNEPSCEYSSATSCESKPKAQQITLGMSGYGRRDFVPSSDDAMTPDEKKVNVKRTMIIYDDDEPNEISEKESIGCHPLFKKQRTES
jgi:hypothetical protein